MKIGIDFNKDVWETKENIDKLLSSGVVYKEDDFDEYSYPYFIDVSALEELDEALSKIEKMFNLDVDLLISSNRLSIFLEFDVK